MIYPVNLCRDANFHGVTGGMYKIWKHIHRTVAYIRLLTIPTSCSRISENNLNYDNFLRFALIHIFASFCHYLCNTWMAQFIRVIMTWRHLLLLYFFCNYYLNYRGRFRSLIGINQTSHDTNLRQPCNACIKHTFYKNNI